MKKNPSMPCESALWKIGTVKSQLLLAKKAKDDFNLSSSFFKPMIFKIIVYVGLFLFLICYIPILWLNVGKWKQIKFIRNANSK
jgi:hypothetical protein